MNIVKYHFEFYNDSTSFDDERIQLLTQKCLGTYLENAKAGM